jgi:CoA:oxalate CoA-transferase
VAVRHGANAYLAAPYGVYPTQDGYLALAMTPLATVEALLDLPGLAASGDGFVGRDAMLARISARLAERTTDAWLALLEPAGIWCAPVLDWPALLESESFRALDMLQRIGTRSGTIRTTASPLRIDGTRPTSARGAPDIGQHTRAIAAEFALDLG